MRNFLIIFFVFCGSLLFCASCVTKKCSDNSLDLESTQSDSVLNQEVVAAEENNQIEKSEIENEEIQEDVISKKEFTKNDYAKLILESYCNAYPEKNMSLCNVSGEWGILAGGVIYFWADGKLLPEKFLDEKDSYGEQQIYPYTGQPRNPSLYTKEKIEELRLKGTKGAIAAEKKVDTGFHDFILDSKSRAIVESHIKKTQLFGCRVNVHEMIVPLLAKIDSEVKALAQEEKALGKTEINDFLNSIYEIGGYNWRSIDGTNSRKSYHSCGVAIDITIKNNNKTTYWEWERVWNSNWMLVPQNRLWAPPEKVTKIFEKYGFVWGGTWDEYDTMHFEYRPELHEIHKKLVELGVEIE